MRRQLRRNALTGSTAAVMTASISLLSYPIYIHHLGYEQYGIWLILTTPLALVQLSNLGLGPALTALVAEDAGRGDLAGARAHLLNAVAMLLALGSLLVAVSLVLRNQILGAFALNGQHLVIARAYLPVMALLTAYALLVEAFNAALAGTGRYDRAVMNSVISQALALAVSTSLLRAGRGIPALAIGVLSSYLVMSGLAIVQTRHVLWSARTIGIDRARLRRLWVAANWVSGASLLTVMVSPLNKVLLSRFAGLAGVSQFDIAYSLAMRIRSVFECGLRALIPQIGCMYGAEGANCANAVRRVAFRASSIVAVVGAPVFAVAFLLSDHLLRLWLGERYAPSISAAFRPLLAGCFINLVSMPVYYSVLGLGYASLCFRSAAVFFASYALVAGVCAHLTASVDVSQLGYTFIMASMLSAFVLVFEAARTHSRLRAVASQLSCAQMEDAAINPVHV